MTMGATETKTMASYLEMVKEMFRYPTASDHVRITLADLGVMSIMLSAIFCVPVSVVIGIMWLIDPMEDSIFLFMSIPWIFIVPAVCLGLYVFNYRKPRKNDATVIRLFSEVETDSPIVPENGRSHSFLKNGFVFITQFEKGIATAPSGRIKSTTETLHVYMLFECNRATLHEYRSLTEDMYAYLQGKPIGDYIYTNGISFRLSVGGLKTMTPDLISLIGKIVDEYIYLTERFHLSPITPDDFNKQRERIDNLLKEDLSHDTERDT